MGTDPRSSMARRQKDAPNNNNNNNHNNMGTKNGTNNGTTSTSAAATKNNLASRYFVDDPLGNQHRYFDSALFPETTKRPNLPPRHDHGSGNLFGAPSPIMAFRDVDSTQRAVLEVKQRAKRQLERRRAMILLVGLLGMAFSVHLFSSYEKQRNRARARASSNHLKAKKKEEDGRSKKSAANQIKSVSTPLDLMEGFERLKVLSHYVDVTSAFNSTQQTPVFFHVPRSGGQTIKEIVGQCLGKVQASEVGSRKGHKKDTSLQVVTIDNGKYVNVDTTSVKGLKRAGSMGLAESGLADMITSSYFVPSAESLFSHIFTEGLQLNASEIPPTYGRVFTMFRPPVERAVSMYYYQHADVVSLEEYAKGNGIENNWMTRFLTDTMEGDLTTRHLEQAKDILRQKVLIGFWNDPKESIYRIFKYNQWLPTDNEMLDEKKKFERDQQQQCIEHKLTEKTNEYPGGYEMPKKGSQAYALISWQTQYDNKLFDFAKELFDAQTKQWGSKQRKKELKQKKQKAKQDALMGKL